MSITCDYPITSDRDPPALDDREPPSAGGRGQSASVADVGVPDLSRALKGVEGSVRHASRSGNVLCVSAEARLGELGHVLPPEPRLPPGVSIPFQWVRVVGERCLVSGHGALTTAGVPAGPFGRVPSEVSLEDAQGSALAAALATLAALRRTIGSLDRIAAWLMVNGYVNADEGYTQTTAVLNPVSELILDVFGPDIGAHARTAIGVRALPLNLPVVFSAEVLLAP